MIDAQSHEHKRHVCRPEHELDISPLRQNTASTGHGSLRAEPRGKPPRPGRYGGTGDEKAPSFGGGTGAGCGRWRVRVHDARVEQRWGAGVLHHDHLPDHRRGDLRMLLPTGAMSRDVCADHRSSMHRLMRKIQTVFIGLSAPHPGRFSNAELESNLPATARCTSADAFASRSPAVRP